MSEQTIKIKGVDVPYTVESSSIDVKAIVETFVPWKDWVDSLDEHMHVSHVHFQSMDYKGKNVGFVKFKADASVGDEKKRIPGIVLLRGGAIACLIEAICDGKSYALLIEQPRFPSGKSNFREVVAGMLDGDNHLAGSMIREVQEEVGLTIQVDKLIDLTELAQGPNVRGMYPSIGLCDEFIRLFLYRVEMTKTQLDSLEGRLGGLKEEGEYITLCIHPLDDLWKTEYDSKTLCCLFLREKLLAAGKLPAPIKFEDTFVQPSPSSATP
ncbi:putative hydrolase, NUDIX family protein [Monocercomonoides exilis]|uniref:putative hydrolase, NUDIX family protein n=1 Tax=Monocercomonoides exilis TaxID=2049356 RepID=UPI00355AB5B1|nr:putative hydrolase, NUDIX family protein [Monocercomonoides exilis]|eukprot:MONOS_13170.1-p1 / transcript=MONOS_13170.1 / gene=MONOS_13170 / organism=Monocercomonoides_exilis_PA203 / gene_product=hydrolase, NUDIX family protein / transcript_product=hydrolase, NUDIX family protein / location=Mono_scaffold00785:16760-17817(+) / protein_length=267 / sequence_SO=supercontig / SO=protein_coding / is_pseudo=false